MNAIKKIPPREHLGGVNSAHSARAPVAPDSERLSRAFQQLFESQAATAWRALLHFGVSEAEVEDAAQEVFVIAHQKLAEGTELEHPRAWVYGIAWRVAAAFRRRARHRHEVLGDVEEPEAESNRDPARQLEDRRRLVKLDRALASLADEQRAVFVLYEIEELTMREVSEALACSINTAFSRLYAARRKLCAALGIQVSEEVWKR